MAEATENKKKSHGNTRLPFGLCKREGINIPDNATPRDAWEALIKKGITPKAVYSKLTSSRNKKQEKTYTTIGEDRERLVQAGKYDIIETGGYADRERQILGIENFETKRKVDEYIGKMPDVKAGKKQKIEWNKRAIRAYAFAAREYAKDAREAKTQAAKDLFLRKRDSYIEYIKDARKNIDWIERAFKD